MGIPKLITDLGIDATEFAEAIPTMAQAALKDKCTLTNPRSVTAKDLEAIYARIYRGGF